MTRILVQRGPTSSSSNQSRASLPGSSSTPTQQPFTPQIPSAVKDEEHDMEHDEEHEEEVLDLRDVHVQSECGGIGDEKTTKNDEVSCESNQSVGDETLSDEFIGKEDSSLDVEDSGVLIRELDGLQISGTLDSDENGSSSAGALPIITGRSYPPPPIPLPKPSAANLSSRRTVSSGSNAMRSSSSRRLAVAWPVVSTSPSGSRPSSPRSFGEAEAYNNADEQGTYFGPSYDDVEREGSFLPVYNRGFYILL